MSAPVIRRTPLHSATVTAVRDLTPRMRRVTLHSPTLVVPRPAQDVELVLAEDTGRKVKRRYTIRHFRPDTSEFDVDALQHGHGGPGSAWAATTAPGDPVDFFGPRGRLELRAADWHLFVGDESALPAFAALIEALPGEQAAIALIEVADPSDEVALTRAAGELSVRWLHRGGSAPGTADLLARAMDELRPPPGAGHAYLLGESRAMVQLRPHLEPHGIGTDRTFLKGYWNVGRRSARQ
jgi:NADPH-dependent ferric siderophore reductase